MENLNAVRLQKLYESLKEQRDDAQDHIQLCLRRHDDDAVHYWSEIRNDISKHMADVHMEVSKLFKKEEEE